MPAPAVPHTYKTTSAVNGTDPVLPTGSLSPELVGSCCTATTTYWFWRFSTTGSTKYA